MTKKEKKETLVTPKRASQFIELQNKIEYTFHNPSYLLQALDHPSAVPHNKEFERLEFLGDRVLGLAIATLLLQIFPKATEGQMAKKHAALVSREMCYQLAQQLSLEDVILKICDVNALANMPTIMADAMEALLGAIFLDGGLTPCHQLIAKLWQPWVCEEVETIKDSKTKLQEWLQKKKKCTPTYTLHSQTGSAHQPELVYCLSLAEGMPHFFGKGMNRKMAEKDAAEKALVHFHLM